MKKIKSLFKRDYDNTRLVYDEVVEGSGWVARGEGVATIKWDGSSCMIRDGVLYKRYDRKLTKQAWSRKRKNPNFVPTIDDFKPAPDGWEACMDAPDVHTGHYTGWLKVDFELPENKYHLEAFNPSLQNGTYELVGEKVQGNPYGLSAHELWKHGVKFGDSDCPIAEVPPRDYAGIKAFLSRNSCEGIVWHHEDGRMAKIKSRDFGINWANRESRL